MLSGAFDNQGKRAKANDINRRPLAYRGKFIGIALRD